MSQELRFDPSEIPGLPISGRPEVTRARLLSALEAGQVMLVLDPGTSSGPFNPPVSWRPDSGVTAGGRWVSDYGSIPFPLLSQELDRLNRLGETPESIASTGGFGSTPPQTGESAGAVEASGPTDRKLSLPLGAAAGIAPLAEPSPRVSWKQVDDTDLPVHLTIGIFMDGTLNNASNVELFKQRVERECLAPLREDPDRLEDCRERLRLLMGESYANAPTNVVKLFELYEEGKQFSDNQKTIYLKVYESGVGTRSGEEDSLWGMSTGLGETGVVAQVRRAFERLATRVKGETDFAKVRKVVLDLFGFSRGAVAARFAIHEILRGSAGLFGQILREKGLEWPKALEIRFVGLFDSVAGIVNPFRLDISAANDRNSPVEIYLDSSSIGSVVQLAAVDEMRENFALNSLYSPNKTIPSNFREIYLPGAHSDIGGGYAKEVVEELLLFPSLAVTGSNTKWPRETLEWDSLNSIQELEKSEGWIGERSLPLKNGHRPRIIIEEEYGEHPAPDGRVELKLKMERVVRGGLSCVSLHLLHGVATDAGAPFREISVRKNMEIPSELVSIYEKISEQVEAGVDRPVLDQEQSEILKQRYTHHSHHYNLFEFMVWDEVARLEPPLRKLHPSQPMLSRERVAYPNQSTE
ncbi:T6SS phospholipase effector Tle1-like catalytic domain-containing protein [Marinobacter sp. F4206]|uniref:T6SS phospholipase effector Tle1-like catalytic domain-containing protein n=1 Tax=Marinobacter sp. F4206 TaxID=2861777 RepID=UPI001C5ECA44|nr:DUF2235 domain-containing protein [Marinobacter sp. F4206]MBW4933869.1 DUF2235 domain-containing protein [Marinobacter sp. F4206]